MWQPSQRTTAAASRTATQARTAAQAWRAGFSRQRSNGRKRAFGGVNRGPLRWISANPAALKRRFPPMDWGYAVVSSVKSQTTGKTEARSCFGHTIEATRGRARFSGQPCSHRGWRGRPAGRAGSQHRNGAAPLPAGAPVVRCEPPAESADLIKSGRGDGLRACGSGAPGA